MRRCSASSSAYASPVRCRSRVEPSMSLNSSVTVPLGGPDMSLHYRAAREKRQVQGLAGFGGTSLVGQSLLLGFGGRLQLSLGRFAGAELAAPLGLRVDLGAEKHRDRAQPQ